jgi:hypothetical protein
VEKQLDLQWQHWDQVDGRLRLLLGFIGAIFVATLAFTDRTNGLSGSAKVLLITAVVLLIASGLIATLAWLPRRFDRPPKPLTLREEYLTSAKEETILAVVDTMVRAYDENEMRIDEKLAGFRNDALILGVAVLAIARAAIIEIAR